jgi:hypothetical protein
MPAAPVKSTTLSLRACATGAGPMASASCCVFTTLSADRGIGHSLAQGSWKTATNLSRRCSLRSSDCNWTVRTLTSKGTAPWTPTKRLSSISSGACQNGCTPLASILPSTRSHINGTRPTRPGGVTFCRMWDALTTMGYDELGANAAQWRSYAAQSRRSQTCLETHDRFALRTRRMARQQSHRTHRLVKIRRRRRHVFLGRAVEKRSLAETRNLDDAQEDQWQEI